MSNNKAEDGPYNRCNPYGFRFVTDERPSLTTLCSTFGRGYQSYAKCKAQEGRPMSNVKPRMVILFPIYGSGWPSYTPYQARNGRICQT